MTRELDELHDRLDDLEDRLVVLESRIEVVSQDYVGLDKLREELDALKRAATITDGGSHDE